MSFFFLDSQSGKAPILTVLTVGLSEKLVPTSTKPVDCWWEPIAHTTEGRTRHLHRKSLDGEAGELMVPSYNYRKELIAYNESMYEAHKGEDPRS